MRPFAEVVILWLVARDMPAMGPIGAHAARRSEDDSIFRRRKAQKLGDDVVGNEEAKSKLEPIMRNSAIM